MLQNQQINQTQSWRSILPLFLIVLIWAIYITANIISRSYNICPPKGICIPGIIKYIVDNGTILSLAIYSFILWHKTAKGSMAKITFLFFALAHCALFIAATVYNSTYNILHLAHSKYPVFWSSIDDVFFTGYLFFGFLFFLFILLNKKINITRPLKIYITIVWLMGILFITSFYDIKWNFSLFFSINTFYELIEKILEILCLIVGVICVIKAKNRGIFYVAIGILISVFTEVILAFGFLSQKYGLGSIVENGWVLGELLSFYGLILLSTHKDLNDVPAWISKKINLH